MSQVVILLQRILVTPATKATSEQSLSALRRLKTDLQSVMTQQLLNHCTVLNVQKEECDALSLKDVATDFVMLSEHHYSIFLSFSSSYDCTSPHLASSPQLCCLQLQSPLTKIRTRTPPPCPSTRRGHVSIPQQMQLTVTDLDSFPDHLSRVLCAQSFSQWPYHFHITSDAPGSTRKEEPCHVPLASYTTPEN